MKNNREKIYDLTVCLYVFFAVVTDAGSVTMKLARLGLTGIWVLKLLFEREFKPESYVLRMIPFWMFTTLTVLWAENREFAVGMSKTLLINLICMCALISLIDRKKERIDLVLKTMAFAPLVLELRVISLGGLLAFLDARGVGTIVANTVGLCAAFGACFAIYFWLRGEKWYSFLFLLNIAVLMLSASKKALLCVGIPIMILYLLDVKTVLKQRMIRCVLVLLTGLAGFWMVMRIPALYALIGSRLDGMFAVLTGNMAGADGSSESRILLITRGIHWFRERPVLGYGIDCYRAVLVKNWPLWPIDYYAHNNYVELLVDTGIIGTALYYWNYGEILRNGWKGRKFFGNTELLIFGMMVALLIGEVALVSYYDKYVQVLLVMLWLLMSEFHRTVYGSDSGK